MAARKSTLTLKLTFGKLGIPKFIAAAMAFNAAAFGAGILSDNNINTI